MRYLNLNIFFVTPLFHDPLQRKITAAERQAFLVTTKLLNEQNFIESLTVRAMRCCGTFPSCCIPQPITPVE